MATIVLSAVGAAFGASIGGGLLGLSSVVIGRAIGASLGRVIDESLLGAGSKPVETGKVERFRLTGASEGAPVAQIYGRTRVAGQVIWATRFQEHKGGSGSGKGISTGPKTVEYSYTVSLAIALCEGEITRVGRIWADGKEIAPGDLNLRVYAGTEDQMPDPKIEAVNGAGMAPAYRGIAYVVLEDLDVTRFGNRVPQLNFEVFRPEQPNEAAEIARGVRAVALVPGTGEYAYATTPVYLTKMPGVSSAVNVNSPSGKTDFATSLDMLDEELPNCGAVSLVVSWFGNDLRCGTCQVQPRVEQTETDAAAMPWSVSGLPRSAAGAVPLEDGRPVYGGTPTDQSVKEAIAALNGAGKAVTFYPFILMEQMEGNSLVNPYTGEAPQPQLPWRGRITASLAPGISGSPDGTASAVAEVDAFFGEAQPGDFTATAEGVNYTGPAEWSYRRFILHYAHLCAAAGGVETFLIGSEMRGLAWIRGAGNSFPAVAALRQLAADVRGILGPQVKIGYAADWSEYSGYHPEDGSGDLFYHLDPLWADANIDFIGIDNYLPLSDWREGSGHADAGQWDSIYNLEYLKSNILGGEGYDWYYHTQEAEALQQRTPISDGAYDKAWVFRRKDFHNWWRNTHTDRIAGYEVTDLPLNGPQPFDGDFSTGDAYWLGYIVHAEWDLATAPTFTQKYAEPEIVTVPGEGNVIEVASAYRIMTERGWRPFLPGQEVSITIRTRLLSEPADGNPHRTYIWLVTIGADGSYTSYMSIANLIGLTVADGWVDYGVTIKPEVVRGLGLIPPDAKGWRLMVGFNGWTPHSPVGAVQQIASVRIVAQASASPWVPGSKPIRFTEMGCAAVDKGTNQPNRFLDPKSSESALPKHSNGRRDDFIQMQYLRAMREFWSDPANNVTDPETGVQMIDMSRAHVWAWDARPYPFFPGNTDLWSDGGNYARGHWLNGRASSRSLGSVVSEICTRSGVPDCDVSRLYGLVRGYGVAETAGARAALQPLMLAHGFEAAEREGRLAFFTRAGRIDAALEPGRLALTNEQEGALELIRAPEAELAGRIRLNFTEADGDYETRAAEAILPGYVSRAVSQSEMPLVLTRSEGRVITERWLAEARVARDRLRFALPPSALGILAGDVVALETGAGEERYRLDRIETAGVQVVEAVRVEPGMWEPSDASETAQRPRAFTPAVPVFPLFLDLPLMSGEEVAHAPHLAVTAEPWPGSVAAYASASDAGYALNTLIPAAATLGLTQTPLIAARAGLVDHGPALRVRLSRGALASVAMSELLNGANLAAIGDGSAANWELFQFAGAALVEPGVYDLTLRLRGQAGSDALMPAEWPAGSYFVLLDGAPRQIELALAARGLARHYRIGPSLRPYDDPVFQHRIEAFDGNGLRPLAPVHLKAVREGVGDVHLSWVRRTRIDGDSWQSEEVPLGEAAERYAVRVMDGATVVRMVEVTVPAWSYTAAQQAGDGVVAPFRVEVAQVSESFGPGPFRPIDVMA
jgi:hypothetical protein